MDPPILGSLSRAIPHKPWPHKKLAALMFDSPPPIGLELGQSEPGRCRSSWRAPGSSRPAASGAPRTGLGAAPRRGGLGAPNTEKAHSGAEAQHVSRSDKEASNTEPGGQAGLPHDCQKHPLAEKSGSKHGESSDQRSLTKNSRSTGTNC